MTRGFAQIVPDLFQVQFDLITARAKHASAIEADGLELAYREVVRHERRDHDGKLEPRDPAIKTNLSETFEAVVALEKKHAELMHELREWAQIAQEVTGNIRKGRKPKPADSA